MNIRLFVEYMETQRWFPENLTLRLSWVFDLLEFQTKVYARLDRNATLGERSGGAIDATVYKECVVACVGEVSSP